MRGTVPAPTPTPTPIPRAPRTVPTPVPPPVGGDPRGGGGTGTGTGTGTPPPVTPPAPNPNAWAYKPPTDIQTLLRQLSANAGQEFMPYGPGGDVRQPIWGTNGQPEMNVDASTYGETGGETNFFQTTTKGGMAPISAAPRTATDWNPLGGAKSPTTTPGTTPAGGDSRDARYQQLMSGTAPAPAANPTITPEQLASLLQLIFPTQ